MHFRAFHLVSLCFVLGTAADPNDWVNVDYIKQAASKSNPDTTAAVNSIVSKADSTTQKGPWTIINKNIKPPSGDVRDYLSWAPYHWPDCNWCSKGSSHFANPNATDGDSGDDPEGDWGDDSGPEDDDPPSENGGIDDSESESEDLAARDPANLYASKLSAHFKGRAFRPHHRMKRVQRLGRAHLEAPTTLASRQDDGANSDTTQDTDSAILPTDETPAIPTTPTIPATVPTQPPSVDFPQPPAINPNQPTTTSNRIAGTGAPAQAPAKTGGDKCTPSPTKSLAPSATWTTCPYVVRDGKVNPDTDTLVGPDAVQNMSQSVLYNAVAYALQKTSKYSQNVANFIDAFFLSPTTGMHPNVNFGQQVRGPGEEQQMGTFTGILDIRGLVKVVNAVQLMRTTQSPDWTSAREQAMTNWMTSYVGWLQGSDIGKETASKANNHLTFYVNQIAAGKTYLGDTKGAATALQQYFSNQFLDQIAQSGEQPFEAIRTRPFHYRCFNMEAMITNAKLGDQLGLNLWTAKSKYGATIQTALDYIMTIDPKGEDISDIFPHVAAVAAAYGDPKGKYAAFLQKNFASYKSQPFWFYDQSAALPHSPAGGKNKRRDDTVPIDHSSTQTPDIAQTFAGNGTEVQNLSDSGVPASTQTPTIPFECPAVFQLASEVELEDGLYVTCDQLRPFFEIPTPLDLDT